MNKDPQRLPLAGGRAPELEAELDLLLARAGLSLGMDRRPVMLACLAEVRRWGALICATSMEPSNEPANVYDIRTTTDRVPCTVPWSLR